MNRLGGLVFGAALTLASGCGSVIQVLTSGHNPAAGADVFANGKLLGTTDGDGKLNVGNQLNQGDQLFARQRVFEQPAYRPDHDGWTMRVYQMSLIVQADGSTLAVGVTDPKAVQQLTVSPDNTLIGIHLVSSIDFDASDADITQLTNRFIAASQYLYNLTDGQFFFEEVTIADSAQLWHSAEILFAEDQFTRPHTTFNGGFLGSVGGAPPVIVISPFANTGFGSQDPSTIVHEFGHLGFTLQDEYLGALPQNNYCTEARHSSTNTEYSENAPKAACAMDSQVQSAKMCSNLGQNAHRGGSLQNSPCWDVVRGAYADGRGGSLWSIRTPDTRGWDVGTLPPLPAGLQTRVIPLNQKSHDLCAAFRFNAPGGAAAANAVVKVRPAFWSGDYNLGVLDTAGGIQVYGVHLGDTLFLPNSTFVVDSTMCVVTQ